MWLQDEKYIRAPKPVLDAGTEGTNEEDRVENHSTVQNTEVNNLESFTYSTAPTLRPQEAESASTLIPPASPSSDIHPNGGDGTVAGNNVDDSTALTNNIFNFHTWTPTATETAEMTQAPLDPPPYPENPAPLGPAESPQKPALQSPQQNTKNYRVR